MEKNILGVLSSVTDALCALHDQEGVKIHTIEPLFSQQPVNAENPFAHLIDQALALGLNPGTVFRIAKQRLGIHDPHET